MIVFTHKINKSKNINLIQNEFNMPNRLKMDVPDLS